MINLVLIGVGLIGGSLALDLKRRKLVDEVVGIDIDADNLARALERKVIDRAATCIDIDSVGQANLVVIATPVGSLPGICRQLEPVLPPNVIISDVGSTKQLALAAYAEWLPQHYRRCVAAHPIAGSDRHGALAAQFGLFEHKKCIVCTHEQQDAESVAQVAALWAAVGAEIHYLTAPQHDAVFAAVSHLPHMLAYAYVHQIAQSPNKDALLHFAGSGFRDFTRIAGSHPAIWVDICLANRQPLLDLLQQQQQELAYLQHCLQQADGPALFDFFEQAQAARVQWQSQ
ncbi:prephenate dehydrogenase [Snodgrassella sp. CFCC 13594]|uniref:prephenate dehydrogenase n=1 Tax=Snodgrassella sp. CFCC 13594 TaxID=1775559 RepID=UPI0008331E83|nr:prephenate dehydrogenase [Snodgrassella sp. CFCC 13594]